MHSHEANPDHSHTETNFITRHLMLLIIIIVVGVGLYSLTADISIVTTATILILLAHILAVAVVVFVGRNFFTRMIRKFHGVPDSPAQTETHNHSHDLETTGETINWANAYDVFVRFVMMGQYQKLIQSAVEIANIQANETVLDVGCGTGTLAIAAKKASHSSVVIHGSDAAPEMIDRARQKASEAGVDIEFSYGLVENIQADDNSYDLVMNSLMVHHLPDELRDKAFAEIYRVLKPGGRLLVVDFEPPKNRLTRAWLSLTPVKQMLQIDNSVIPPQLEKAGFQNIKVDATASSIATAISARKA